MIASELGNESIVRVLTEHPETDLNAKDWNGRTALTVAALEGHDGIVQHLSGILGIQT